MDTIGLSGKNVEKKAEAIPFLSDEIITNILVRLPARSVMRCRFVCRKWRDLTLDRDFVDLNFKNSVPTILVAPNKSYRPLQLFVVLDKWWEPATTWETTYRFTMNPLNIGMNSFRSGVLFSHAGLIVLREAEITSIQEKIIILNPARPNSESMSITLSKQLGSSEIIAVYYHPPLKGYCSLWKLRCILSTSQPNRIQYMILRLGSNPSLKMISNPFLNRVMLEDAVPLLINNYLYWKLESEQQHRDDGHNDILKFDTIREEFIVMPCPVPLLTTECDSYHTHLLNCDGILSFLLILPRKITIWRLEGHTEQLWTTNEYTFSMEICHSYELVNVIAVVDGKLALWSYRGLRVCNLMEGTVRKYPGIALSGDMFLSYQISLASQSNGTTSLFIDQDDNVGVA